MGELFGWMQIFDLVTSAFSRESRRDYPVVLLMIILAVGCTFIWWEYFS